MRPSIDNGAHAESKQEAPTSVGASSGTAFSRGGNSCNAHVAWRELIGRKRAATGVPAYGLRQSQLRLSDVLRSGKAPADKDDHDVHRLGTTFRRFVAVRKTCVARIKYDIAYSG
jgi:hypothetical protein